MTRYFVEDTFELQQTVIVNGTPFYTTAQVQGAKVYLFATGTGVTHSEPTVPTGTAVTGSFWDAASGGTALSNPLTTDANGHWQAYFDTQQRLDVVYSDNNHSAVIAGTTSIASFPQKLDTQDMSIDTLPPAVVSGNNLQRGFGAPAPVANHFAVDLSLYSYFRLNMTATAVNVDAPTNTTSINQFTLIIKNTSGGSITPAFNAAYHLADTFTAPAAGLIRCITFAYDSTDAVWREISRTGDDQS